MAQIDNKKVRKIIFDKLDGHCAYCGEKLKYPKFTVDHIVPKRRGSHRGIKGNDEINNYNPCCGSCNSSKSVFSLEVWRGQIQQKVKNVNRYSSNYRILKRFGLIKEVNIPVIFHFERFLNGR